jgi:hypothetical protein
MVVVVEFAVWYGRSLGKTRPITTRKPFLLHLLIIVQSFLEIENIDHGIGCIKSNGNHELINTTQSTARAARHLLPGSSPGTSGPRQTLLDLQERTPYSRNPSQLELQVWTKARPIREVSFQSTRRFYSTPSGLTISSQYWNEEQYLTLTCTPSKQPP